MVVVPDVGLWAQLGEIFDLLGAQLAVVLLCCTAGLILSAVAWVVGTVGDLGGMATKGRSGVVVSLACAASAPALGPMIGWLIGLLS